MNTSSVNESDIKTALDERGGACSSTAKKLVIVVPECCGTKLETEQGDPVTNWEGKPIEGEGFTFFNQVASGEKTLQAVRTNGIEVIIFNNLSAEQEEKIKESLEFDSYELYRNDGNPDPVAKINPTTARIPSL